MQDFFLGSNNLFIDESQPWSDEVLILYHASQILKSGKSSRSSFFEILQSGSIFLEKLFLLLSVPLDRLCFSCKRLQ